MSFHSFYNTWIEQLWQLQLQLRQAPPTLTAEEHHHQLRNQVQKLMFHYEEYYRVKSSSAKNDVLSLFSAPWTSVLERSLHWIGGWRPTTAFHLIYSESSILFESHVVDILRGRGTGDLGDLSPGQFRRVSELQCETVQEENEITDELSEWQEGANYLAGTYDDIDRKIERLAGILVKADELRLKTIKNLVEMLTPKQAAEFFIGAAELHFGIRGWGLEQDRRSYIRQ
ncbi:LOW QUALITY PROTEIN: protein DOG1-like 3 [Primulina tabacum]|uniref:LOW QUALITY PROTEIN: protein DOG1-like 3 n=1 Tax=Primulina tabacum TaxID=48773 RepID=UPI003F599613